MKFPTDKMRSAAIVAGAVALLGGGSALAANVPTGSSSPTPSPSSGGPQWPQHSPSAQPDPKASATSVPAPTSPPAAPPAAPKVTTPTSPEADNANDSTDHQVGAQDAVGDTQDGAVENKDDGAVDDLTEAPETPGD